MNRRILIPPIKRKRLVIAFVLLAVIIAIPFYIWRFDKWFIKVRMQYSIGIYAANNPFAWSPAEGIINPVLKVSDVTDVETEIVADPFMVQENDVWYMFFEVVNVHATGGDIALATSDDGLHWRYSQVVLHEPFSMSFPYVFKWQSDYYMIPETHQANAIRLYKADAFPTRWSFAGVLIQGMYVDPAIVRYKDKWWLFAADVLGNDKLRLFYADDLMGPWLEHPKSPVVSGDNRIARPGGRVIVYYDQVIRYAQDDSNFYGKAVRGFIIDVLTPTDYRDHEAGVSPILKGSAKHLTWTAWNAKGMHTLDPHQIGPNQWIACVDGFYKYHYWTWAPLRHLFGYKRPHGE